MRFRQFSSKSLLSEIFQNLSSVNRPQPISKRYDNKKGLWETEVEGIVKRVLLFYACFLLLPIMEIMFLFIAERQRELISPKQKLG